MKKKKVLLIGVGILAFLLLVPGMASAQTLFSAAEDLIIQFEGFSATPYWDKKRYSWGYGTAAPGPTGTITPAQAKQDLQTHVQADYNYLYPLVTRTLNQNQWAAFLSFSYNEGTGGADNLIANINSGDNAALEQQWKLYIYADGEISQTLIDRRNIEWQVWIA